MTIRKIVVIGANGQVGSQLVKVLEPLANIIAIDRSQLDLEKLSTIKPFLEKYSPDLIINAAAYTAVDKAEAEQEKAKLINADAPTLIADYATGKLVPLIHYSTDYVFDGTKTSPYLESDTPSPQSIYGQTKLAGEQVVASSGADYLIFRTSWVYGLHGSNFLLTMLRFFRERDELSIVNDQLGAPTSALAIAHATAQIINKLWDHQSDMSLSDYSGVYHMTAAGQTSWYDFAQAILEYAQSSGIECKLSPISTAEYPTAATRPAYSVLDNQKLNDTFAVRLPDWEQQLDDVMQQWLINIQ